MKRALWFAAMATVALVAVSARPQPAFADGGCGAHCVTSGFCDASCWSCKPELFGNVCRN